MYFTGLPITEQQLKEAAIASGVLQIADDYLESDFRDHIYKIFIKYVRDFSRFGHDFAILSIILLIGGVL